MVIALWAALERFVAVANVMEEVQLVLRREERRANRVHGRITPTFIVKPAGTVEVFEELAVSLASPEVKVTDLKVRPN